MARQALSACAVPSLALALNAAGGFAVLARVEDVVPRLFQMGRFVCTASGSDLNGRA